MFRLLLEDTLYVQRIGNPAPRDFFVTILFTVRNFPFSNLTPVAATVLCGEPNADTIDDCLPMEEVFLFCRIRFRLAQLMII